MLMLSFTPTNRFMPPAKSEWSVFNFVAGDQNHESMCTVWMNRFHDDWQRLWNDSANLSNNSANPWGGSGQTNTPYEAPATVGESQFLESLATVAGAFIRQQGRRIWFCGSYAMPGIPLLESAVKSATEISDAILNCLKTLKPIPGLWLSF